MSDLAHHINGDVIEQAIRLGYSKEDVMEAVQEGGIIALNAVPGDTITDESAVGRMMSLVTTGLMYEKGMLTERKT